MLSTMATALSQIPTTDYRLGFQSQEEETAVERLPVQGEMPAWLTGSLMRVTPAKLEAGDKRVGHWFDGLACLNRFGFADGQVSYRSRFLDSGAYRAAQAGEHAGGTFGTDPCRSIFKRVQSVFSPEATDNANVNLVRIGERYIAMTETPLPIEFDPETLDTVGPMSFTDKGGGQATTAHPHHDPERNELLNYSVHFSRKSEYRLWGLPAGSTSRRQIASLPVDEPAYMHAFGMSERYLILAEYPLRVNPLRLVFSGKAFIKNYRWQPELGTRFLVFDRETGAHRGTYETDAFFCFHHVNAFERGNELVIDLVAFEDNAIIDALYLDEHGPVAKIPPSELRRYTIGLDSGSVRHEALTEHTVELPRIDYRRRNTRDYQYAYFAGGGADSTWLDKLVKVDVGKGEVASWSEDGCYPGEAIFVRTPGEEAEDGGIILSVVLDTRAERSFLLVLDAGSFGELARAEAPHHIPFGFHGQYLR
jgi:beta,beta-carotene 9',10'-dioxygenase